MQTLAQAITEGSTVMAGVVATVVAALQLVTMFLLRWMRAAQVMLQQRVKHLETEVETCHEQRFELCTEVGQLKITVAKMNGHA